MVNIIAFILTWYSQLFILESVLSFLNRHTIMLVLNGFPFLCLSCSNLLVIVFLYSSEIDKLLVTHLVMTFEIN